MTGNVYVDGFVKLIVPYRNWNKREVSSRITFLKTLIAPCRNLNAYSGLLKISDHLILIVPCRNWNSIITVEETVLPLS